MCFASKESSAAVIGLPVTGTISRGWIKPELRIAAIADHGLALAVARHKAVFFAEKDSTGAALDYAAVLSGGLRLVPVGTALESLSTDYGDMVEDGLLLGDAELFDELFAQCRRLQERVNRAKVG